MNRGDTVIPSISAGDFSLDEWQRLRDELRVAEPIFRQIAAEYDLRLLSSARWPELRLQRSSRWTTAELRLALDPGSTPTPQGESRWAIILVRYPKYPWFQVGGSSAETTNVLSAEELRSKDLLRHIRGAIDRLAPAEG